MVDSDDERDFPRMVIDCPVAYRRREETRMREGRGRDLSATGVSFVCDEPFAPGDWLVLHLAPQREITPPLDALAEVVRVEPVEGGYCIACVLGPLPEDGQG